MKRQKKRHSTLFIMLAWAEAGCQGQVPVPAAPVDRPISFAADVQPIFDAHCVACHRPGWPAQGLAGLRMILTSGESYASLVYQPSAQRPELILVTPGDPRASLLWLKVSSNAPPVGSTMPLIGARLTAAQLGLIRDWIGQGAADN